MPAALFIPETEVAKLLGRSVDWLRTNASDLERQYGFPKVDPAVGKRHKESIEAWARKRNMPAFTSPDPKPVENYDAL